jgi:hypothetical protein
MLKIYEIEMDGKQKCDQVDLSSAGFELKHITQDILTKSATQHSCHDIQIFCLRDFYLFWVEKI